MKEKGFRNLWNSAKTVLRGKFMAINLTPGNKKT